MFTATPIGARNRGRPKQFHGFPATQPSQPLRALSNNSNALGSHTKTFNDADRYEGEDEVDDDDASLIPRAYSGSPRRSDSNKSMDLRRSVLRPNPGLTPKPPVTRLLPNEPESESNEEDEDEEDEEEQEHDEQEEEEESDIDDELDTRKFGIRSERGWLTTGTEDYKVPLQPAHEYDESDDNDDNDNVKAYEQEFKKINSSRILTPVPSKVIQNKRRVYNRKKDESDDSDEEIEEEEDYTSWIVQPIVNFWSRLFKIGYKTATMVLGPFFSKRLWWFFPTLLTSLLVLSLSVYSIYYAMGSVMYRAPIAKPDNMDDVVDRLMAVERELATVSRISSSLNAGMQDNYKDHQDKFSKLENEINEASRGIHKISKELARLSNENVEHNDKSVKIADELTTIQKSMTKLQSVVSSQASDQTQLFAIVNDQNNTISHQLATVNSIEKSIDIVKSRIAKLEEAEMGEQSALEMIERYLPQRLAVSIDPKTKEVVVSPEFWSFLENQVRSMYPDTATSAAPQSVDAKVDWDEFLRLNEKAIESIADRRVEYGSSAFITKDEFAAMIAQRLAEQRQSVTQRLEQLDRKIDLYGENTAQESKVEAPTQYALEELVRQQIAKHTSGTLVDKPDFADARQGAKINYEMTTDTYKHTHGKSLWYKMQRGILESVGFGRMIIHGPEIAINDDMVLGSCWPLQGKQGNLGINLAAECIPTDLAIYHVDYRTTLNYHSAPKNISLWAEVDHVSDLIHRGFIGIPGDGGDTGDSGYVKLLQGQFNIKEAVSGIQVFPLPLAIRNERVRTKRVILTVNDNWGNDDYTCLYRVRVFGDRPEDGSAIHAPSGRDIYDDEPEPSFGEDDEL